MEKEFLNKEIERLRSKLELLYLSTTAVSDEVLRVSDQLDALIVRYLQIDGRSAPNCR